MDRVMASGAIGPGSSPGRGTNKPASRLAGLWIKWGKQSFFLKNWLNWKKTRN